MLVRAKSGDANSQNCGVYPKVVHRLSARRGFDGTVPPNGLIELFGLTGLGLSLRTCGGQSKLLDAALSGICITDLKRSS